MYYDILVQLFILGEKSATVFHVEKRNIPLASTPWNSPENSLPQTVTRLRKTKKVPETLGLMFTFYNILGKGRKEWGEKIWIYVS